MSEQLPLLDTAPTARTITLRCPRCRHVWVAAILYPGESTPAETIARRCHCPACEQVPPMEVQP